MIDPVATTSPLPVLPPAPAAAWQPPVYHVRQHRALRRWARATARLALVGSLLLPTLRVPAAHAAPPVFAAPQTNPFGLVDVGTESKPTLADLDSDGDLDVLIGASDGTQRFQRNTGTVLAPAFAAPQTGAFGLVDVGQYSSPTLADLDGDGDLDALIGEQNGTLRYQANTGTVLVPAFAVPQTNPFGLVDVGFYSTPELADLDADGDLDALIGEQNGRLRYQTNTGTVLVPAFAAPQTNPFGLVDVGYFSSPTLADLDGDGDLDFLSGEWEGTLRFHANTGTVLVPAFAARQTNPFGLQDVGSDSAPELADLDGDGDLDALIGEVYGTLRFQRNGPPLAVTLADFAAQAQGATVVVRWSTTVETDNLGFNLWRGTSPDAPTEQLNATLIPTRSPQGATYEWLDASAQSGVTYYYWLDAVGTDGGTTRHGPVSATIEVSSAVTLATLQVTAAMPSAVNPAGLGALVTALLGAVGLGAWARRTRR